MTPGAGIFRTLLPQGFYASGINCGVRRYRPDLGLIISEMDCVATGVFTQSTCKAAPVLHSSQVLPSENIRAIITNSGQANAATGKQGELDNQKMIAAVAEKMECFEHQVLSASTGVIAEPLEVEKIISAITLLYRSLTNIAENFATAIMTTDLVPKTVYKNIQLSQGTVMITGICKGSGMIHPNMATMLGYLLTDAKLTVSEAEVLLINVTDKSFNMISVDGETSTNDSVFLLANGASGVALENDDDKKIFREALLEISIILAKSIVRDGEGATKLIEVQVQNAPNFELAKKIARSITKSPLIKSAIHGESPNWGRVIARIGHEQIAQNLFENMSVYCQHINVFQKNTPNLNVSADLKIKMQEDTIHICIDLQSGTHQATAWGCDLSAQYVQINAEYVG